MFFALLIEQLPTKAVRAGLQRINPDIPATKVTQAIVIWSMTAIAIASLVSGLKRGVRHLSELSWLLGQLVCFYYMFNEDTAYLLNLFVQSLGFYAQWFVQLGFWCNTFVNSPQRAHLSLLTQQCYAASALNIGRLYVPFNTLCENLVS